MRCLCKQFRSQTYSESGLEHFVVLTERCAHAYAQFSWEHISSFVLRYCAEVRREVRAPRFFTLFTCSSPATSLYIKNFPVRTLVATLYFLSEAVMSAPCCEYTSQTRCSVIVNQEKYIYDNTQVVLTERCAHAYAQLGAHLKPCTPLLC